MPRYLLLTAHLMLTVILLAGCGQAGPLALPDDAPPINEPIATPTPAPSVE
jgi:predicted small lipoprotein YifL